jgi:hypothetical protein
MIDIRRFRTQTYAQSSNILTSFLRLAFDVSPDNLPLSSSMSGFISPYTNLHTSNKGRHWLSAHSNPISPLSHKQRTTRNAPGYPSLEVSSGPHTPNDRWMSRTLSAPDLVDSIHYPILAYPHIAEPRHRQRKLNCWQGSVRWR